MSISRTELTTAVETIGERRWLEIVVRAAISCVFLLCMYLAMAEALAWWYFRRGTGEGLAQSIRWDRDNADFYAARARFLQGSLDAGDIGAVIGLYEAATQLGAHRAGAWAELGGAYEWAGREEDAGHAYERAARLFPNSPEIHWQLGNFYLRAGRTYEALRAFEKTVRGDAAMRRAAFDLVWRAGVDPQAILREVIPEDTGIRLDYLNYLIESKRLEDAGRVWAVLTAEGREIEPQAAFPYFDALIVGHRPEKLQTAWAALAQRNPALARWRAPVDNLITNGSFENEILNGALDWRVIARDDVVVAVDSRMFFDGARSLRLEFDGKTNIEYLHVLQYVPVEPNAAYRFSAYLRTRNITTDSGPRLEIFDAYDSSRLGAATENITGTTNWTAQRLEFRTGPETRLLVVRVARPPSRRFGNRISGTVWVDRVSLTAVE